MQPHKRNSFSGPPMGLILNLFNVIVRSFAYSVEVYLHRGFGSRYGVAESAAVLILVPLYASAWPGHDLSPIWLFLQGYLVIQVLHRVGMIFRFRRGNTPFYYTGEPRLGRVLPWLSERTLKLYVEPLVVAALALSVSRWNEPLCGYLFIAGMCLMVKTHSVEQELDREVQEMYDRTLRQQIITERFRQKYSNQF